MIAWVFWKKDKGIEESVARLLRVVTSTHSPGICDSELNKQKP